jgi:chemotaxis protein methyltransferase CheR
MNASTARTFENEVIEEISGIISKITGNQFASKHASMIEFRLKKRCLELKIESLENYLHYFRGHQQLEVNHLISLLTTHHTFFFREFSHFQFLEDKVLPELIPIVRRRSDRKLRVWSAACSKGHEVYSLAMFLDHTLKLMAPDLTFEILGTDIDKESIAFAKNGVYTRKEIKEVPLVYLGNHWARGTGEIAEFVKARNSLRERVRWMEMNLLTIPPTLSEKFDVIFCRNVFIYFNAEQIKRSSVDLLNHLEPHGYYFIGVSESLNGLNLPLINQGPSIYQPGVVPKADLTVLTAKPTTPSSTPPSVSPIGKTPPPAPVSGLHKTLRVLCVDDSPSILTLLKKVLTKEDGFEVVGTAGNGLEAAARLKELKPDLVTLDIHMPGQTGVEYLQKNYHPEHPPVIMVSSVSREESDLALKALHLGASDYVEKPALANLREVSEELKRKLRTAYRNKTVYHQKVNLQLDDAFKKTVILKNPQNYLRIVIAQLSDKKRIHELVQELGRGQPPLFILLDGAKDTLQGFADALPFPNKAIEAWPGQTLKADEIFVADAKKFNAYLPTAVKDKPISIFILGEVAPELRVVAEKWSTAQILVEDLGTRLNGHSPFRELTTDTVPLTSFVYMSAEFLGRQK